MGIAEFLRVESNIREINGAIRRAFEFRRQGGGRMGRVLVVDSDPLFRRMLECALSGAGHSVVTATDGSGAWRALEADQRFDLVVTDIDVPEIHGLQIISSLRRGANPIPILAISTRNGRERDLSLATVFGADRTLVKPFDLRQLLETVRELVAR